jgi:hypothetical protein
MIHTSVCTELVEVPYFFSAVQEEGQGFDKLSPNGIGANLS